jgi:hypothetical protein
MITARQVISGQLLMGADLLERFSSDLSEDDSFFQPTEGGCHLSWILNRLAATQEWALQHLVGRKPPRMT